jgi:hypothetical protein
MADRRGEWLLAARCTNVRARRSCVIRRLIERALIGL